MQIKRELMEGYQSALSGLSSTAKALVLSELATITYTGYYDLHYKLMDVFEMYVGVSKQTAAGYAAGLYDAVRIAEMGEALGAEAIVEDTVEATVETMHAAAALAVEGKTDSFVSLMMSRTGYEIGSAAISALYANAAIDKKADVRFARVPGYSKSYGDGCPFCKMLASRGFVYRNKLTAGEAHHYHDGCTCAVVPSFDGKTGISGYDPKKYKDWYDDNVVREKTDAYKYVKASNATRGYVRYVGPERVASVGGISRERLRSSTDKARAKNGRHDWRTYDKAKIAGNAQSAAQAEAKALMTPAQYASYCKKYGLKQRISTKKLISGEREFEYGIRYGSEAVKVNLQFIETKEFATKFSSASSSAKANSALLSSSKKALRRNTGTKHESMFLIDYDTGDILAEVNDVGESGIHYTQKMRTVIKQSQQGKIKIVALHSHPEGMPPSVDDFQKCFENKYYEAFAIGHNGQLYRYSNKNVDLSIDDRENIYNQINENCLFGYDIDRAFSEVYKEFDLVYDIVE